MIDGSGGTQPCALVGTIVEPGADPRAICIAADRAFAHLLHHLTRWVGDEGARVLLERALDETRAEHPWLAGVRVHLEDERCMAGLEERVDGLGANDVVRTLEALLTGLVDLLARFIGRELATRIVSRGWPAGPPTAGEGVSG